MDFYQSGCCSRCGRPLPTSGACHCPVFYDPVPERLNGDSPTTLRAAAKAIAGVRKFDSSLDLFKKE